MRSIPIHTIDSPAAVLELIFRLKVKDVMTRTILTASPEDSMRDLRELLRSHNITGVPVTEGNRIFGIISMENVIQALDRRTLDETVAQHMSRKLILLEEDMPIFFAISYFGRYSFRRFPVVNRNNDIVGIVTSRDITTRLLMEANGEIERLEQRERETAEAPAEVTEQTERWFKVDHYDFENAGYASTEIKKSLKIRRVDSQIARRIAIAAYELEMNLVLHSKGGSIHFLMDKNRAVVQTDDDGPGIADIEKVLTEGYSTATEWVQSLGFGAGMGLVNARRVSDEFQITSEPSRGTHTNSIIFLNKGEHHEGS
jgi:CBS domain-containing protein